MIMMTKRESKYARPGKAQQFLDTFIARAGHYTFRRHISDINQ
jgi:hypothetical protein